jgi:hypothetical protein
MGISRRSFLAGLSTLTALAGVGLAVSPAAAHPGAHRHPHRRSVRKRQRRHRRAVRRARRRVRRRVRWRVIAGRRALVVPLAVAVGWELLVDDRVVRVTEVHHHHVVVVHSDGRTEELPIAREDTDDNGVELEGSEYEG